MSLNTAKRKISGVFGRLGISTAGHALQKLLFSPFIRAINYHDIYPEHTANFEAHLAYYSKHFVNVNENSLRNFLNGTPWRHDKPGIVLSFDDGLRSHYDAAAPLLEKYGFTGWFFVPSTWIVQPSPTNGDTDPAGAVRTTLATDEVRYLDEHHVVGCHTASHCRLTEDLTDEELQFEIPGAKASLENILGHEVCIFCWVGGEEFSYSKAASDLIKQGFDLSFMTNNAVVIPKSNPMQIQRTNIEAENPLALVQFQLSGIVDLLYFPKRRRVNHLTN